MTTSPLLHELLTHGHQFTFSQSLRLARRFLDPAGEHGLPDVSWHERVAIRPELSLAFPAADVARVELHGDQLHLTTTFLSLYGTASPLPTFYTEDLMDEAAGDESVFRDFLDIIQQRLYHLYFQCWSKYRLAVRIVEESNPVDRQRLLCLIGLGQKELAETVPESGTLLRYTGILSQHPRSAMGLKAILRDALQLATIRITENIQRMVSIPAEQHLCLGVSGCRLGMDTILGSRIADHMGAFRLEIGPLSWQEFNDFLPDSSQHEKLSRLTRFYLCDPLDLDLKLILAAGEAKPLRLGDPHSRLGLNTWCFSGESLGEVSALFPVAANPFTPVEKETSTVAAETESTFIDHYLRERATLGQLANRFMESHPNLVPLMGGPMADPGIQRLLEGTAFCNALLQQKLDDDFPEFIHAVLADIQPGSLRPVPATTIVAFTPQERLTQSQVIPAGAELASTPVDGTRCRFKTCWDVTVHPLTLRDSSYAHPSGKAPRITLQLELHGVTLTTWKAESLRLFLADDHSDACNLYLVLRRHLQRIQITSPGSATTIEIPTDSLKPAGLAPDESLLPGNKNLLAGHHVVGEYHLFRDKFLFLDLINLEQCTALGSSSRFAITFELANDLPVVPVVHGRSFVLAATPVVNLFSHKAEPVPFISTISHHVLRPAARPVAHYRIYSVDRVTGLANRNQDKRAYEVRNSPVYGLQETRACHITRRPVPVGEGFETLISVSPPQDEAAIERIKLHIDLTCTNGTLPERIATGDVLLPVQRVPEHVQAALCKAVTPAIHPDSHSNRHWQMLSGLAQNTIPLNGALQFRAILRLFINPASRYQTAVMSYINKVDAIDSLNAQPSDRLIGHRMYRGYEIKLVLRGEGFGGPGEMYLFSSVLERFLGCYVTHNCFIRLVVEEKEGRYSFHLPARMGDRGVV